MIKSIIDKMSCSAFTKKLMGKANDYIVLNDMGKCPHCKYELNLYMPTLENNRRKELSRCTRCGKDIVVDARIKQVKITYDVKIKKVG